MIERWPSPPGSFAVIVVRSSLMRQFLGCDLLLPGPTAIARRGKVRLNWESESLRVSKTNAVRLLDRLGVRYELRAYEVDPNDLAAETVARKVGLPPEQVFKTLVARGDLKGVGLAVVPGHCELDLKALARVTGDKKIDTVPLKEVEPLTGYIRGGVTALACKKPYPVCLDETARRFDLISISAGMRGLQVLIAPDDYIRVVDARVVPISRDRS